MPEDHFGDPPVGGAAAGGGTVQPGAVPVIEAGGAEPSSSSSSTGRPVQPFEIEPGEVDKTAGNRRTGTNTPKDLSHANSLGSLSSVGTKKSPSGGMRII